MAHFPKPLFKKSRGVWYVQVAGKQHNLGTDRDAAFDRYHALMAAKDPPRRDDDDAPAVVVFDLSLDWCQRHKAARTYDWYRAYLQSFSDALTAGLAVKDLRPFHVEAWLDSKPGWTTGQRALNWAARSGYVTENPVAAR